METQNPDYLEGNTPSFSLTNPKIQISVRALLVANNIKQIDIAKKYFIDPSEVNKVVAGKRKTPHIRRAIAQELNTRLEELWQD